MCARTPTPPHPSSASDKEEFELLHANALTHNCPNNMRSEKKRSSHHHLTQSPSHSTTFPPKRFNAGPKSIPNPNGSLSIDPGPPLPPRSPRTRSFIHSSRRLPTHPPDHGPWSTHHIKHTRTVANDRPPAGNYLISPTLKPRGAFLILHPSRNLP